MNFSTLENWMIPEGNVIKVECNGIVLWELISVPLPEDLVLKLIDFEYTNNRDGTVTLTAWKQTLNGVSSTQCVIPDDSRIIL